MNFSLNFPFLLIFWIHSIVGFSCPNGSEQFPREDVCLYSIANAEPYQDAAQECINLKGNVARIQNIFENAYLLAKIPQAFNNTRPYIGVVKQLNGVWTYADGSPLTYQNWAPGEPTNSTTTNCTIMDSSSGQWRAAACVDSRPFFCTVDGEALQCPDDWLYFEKTDFCYYLQNFTYYDGIHWTVYNFTTAEENCQQMGSHLVSIHSKMEDDFVYDLTLTYTVANMSIVAPQNASCLYQMAWIGLYGTGEIGDGNWTDGTPVDYTGCTSGTGCLVDGRQWYYQIYNDISCQLHLWAGSSIGVSGARYVCKMPPKNAFNRQTKPFYTSINYLN